MKCLASNAVIRVLFVLVSLFASAQSDNLILTGGSWKYTAKDIRVEKIKWKKDRYLLHSSLQTRKKTWSLAQIEFKPGDAFVNANGDFAPLSNLNRFETIGFFIPFLSHALGDRLKKRLIETKDELQEVKEELKEKEKELQLLKKQCGRKKQAPSAEATSKKWCWLF